VKYIRKVKHTFHAKKWTLKVEKPKHEVTIKEASFKDLNSKPFYSQVQYGLGFTWNGGKSSKCRYA